MKNAEKTPLLRTRRARRCAPAASAAAYAVSVAGGETGGGVSAAAGGATMGGNGKTANQNLQGAKAAKKDEFYTQLGDIEKEMKRYKPHFAGKVVYCNCDDPRVSNFFTYFSYGFKGLGLKKLVTACYKSQDMELFSAKAREEARRRGDNDERAIYLEYTGVKNGGNVPRVEDIGTKNFKGDGDFRNEECIELLKQADIVSTNPPFSLFREYVAQLMEHGKKFIIIGNQNAITYKEIFKYIKENKIWLGHSIHSGDREFGVPEDYPLEAAGYRVDDEGNKFIRVKGVRWFTNLDYDGRLEKLKLFKKYTPGAYPKYDNYDAINVDKTKEIPADYPGVMGVPVTFMDKYNPDQFEIVGQMATTKVDEFNYGYPYVNGKKIYARLLIRNKTL